jgi:hypothetical protein
MDLAERSSDQAQREIADQRLELLTPVAKAWCSDRGVEVASLAIQVHGGAGYIEETGIGQYWRDARVGPIYEGANGIQGLDFSRRKLLRDRGKTLGGLMQLLAEGANGDVPVALRPVYDALAPAVEALLHAANRSNRLWQSDVAVAAAGASDLLELAGTVIAGCLVAREALGATKTSHDAARDAIAMAQIYAATVLSRWRTSAALIEGAAVIAEVDVLALVTGSA